MSLFILPFMPLPADAESLIKGSEQPEQIMRDSIIVVRHAVSKKHKIRLYPDADHAVLFFSATGEQGRQYQLFLFDVDGKLVRQVNVRDKQTTVLNMNSKGVFLFEVFSNDERIENGQVRVL